MIYVLDNYDSFTWNLVQAFRILGEEVVVARNDAVRVEAIAASGCRALVVSPGPGRPEEAGISMDAIRALAGRIPILGVCLGHQAIGRVFGASVVRAAELRHGKTSPIHHDGRTLFSGLPDPFEATRYHSLVLDPGTIPAGFEVSARTADGAVMGIRRPGAGAPLEGVQFHPESILTLWGARLLGNFVALAGRWRSAALEATAGAGGGA